MYSAWHLPCLFRLLYGILTLAKIYQYEHAKYIFGCKVVSTVKISDRGGTNIVANYLISSLKDQATKLGLLASDDIAADITAKAILITNVLIILFQKSHDTF
jgi:hypothetical protein